MKKFISTLLILALTLCVLPFAAFAENQESEVERVALNALYFKDKNGKNFYVDPNHLVKRGAKWGDVLVIQDVLKKLSEELNNDAYDIGRVDGDFGEKTYNAVVTFQANHDLYMDGAVGYDTWNSLHNDWEVKLSSKQYNIAHNWCCGFSTAPIIVRLF